MIDLLVVTIELVAKVYTWLLITSSLTALSALVLILYLIKKGD